MSSPRRTSPLDQRPRRRRRLEEPLAQNNTHEQDDESTPMDSSQTSWQSATSLDLSICGSEQLLLDAPAMAPVQVPPGFRAFAARDSFRYIDEDTGRVALPVIPVDAILGPQSNAFCQANVSSDDDDDDEMRLDGYSSLQEEQLIARLGARGRAALSVVQDHSRCRASRREMLPGTSRNQTPPPPALLLYKIHGATSNAPKEGSSSLTTGTYARYLPLVPVARNYPGRGKSRSRLPPSLTIHPIYEQSSIYRPTGPSQAQWVSGEMPVELFEAIARYLSRDDIKSMRLVNREFERGVSRSLFDTVVVPFNTELYDMIEHEKSAKRDLKGKGRANESNTDYVDLKLGNLRWQNALDDQEDKVYKGHGLRVFEGFGSHIRRFGMSFEVKESKQACSTLRPCQTLIDSRRIARPSTEEITGSVTQLLRIL